MPPKKEKIKMSNKSTAVEMRKRIFTVYGLLTNGYTRPYILEHARKSWGVSDGNTDIYISKAKEWIYAQFDEKKSELLKESINTRFSMLSTAIAEGDKGLAHEIQKDLDKLRNLYPAEKLKIGHTMTEWLTEDDKKV